MRIVYFFFILYILCSQTRLWFSIVRPLRVRVTRNRLKCPPLMVVDSVDDIIYCLFLLSRRRRIIYVFEKGLNVFIGVSMKRFLYHFFFRPLIAFMCRSQNSRLPFIIIIVIRTFRFL